MHPEPTMLSRLAALFGIAANGKAGGVQAVPAPPPRLPPGDAAGLVVTGDRPIRALAADEFGLGISFIPRLVRIAVEWPRDDGLVIGMYGSWGVGKTSALNMFTEYVARDRDRFPHTYVCHFNPWFYDDTAVLITSFFSTLAAELGKDEQKPWARAAHALRMMGAILAVAARGAPVLGGFYGGIVAQAISAGSKALRETAELSGEAAGLAEIATGGQRKLEEQRESVVRALEELGSHGGRMVVLVDDVDRLARTELLALLRLVRLVADLPFVSIVLAIDDDRIRDVLETVVAEGYGKAYLDKIVQVGIHVPLPSRETMQRKLLHELERIFSHREIAYPHELRPPRPGEDNPFATLLDCFHTPRDLARYTNSLAVLLLSGEEEPDIHPVDGALVEALHVFHPQVYDRVRRRKHFLTQASGLVSPGPDPGRVEDVRALRLAELSRIIGDDPVPALDQPRRAVVLRLLEHLFGELVDPGRRVYDADASILRRIRSPLAFDTYFRFTNSTLVARRDVEEMLQDLVEMSESATAERLASRLVLEFTGRGREQADRIIEDLGFLLRQQSEAAIRRIGTAVTAAAGALPPHVLIPLVAVVLDAGFRTLRRQPGASPLDGMGRADDDSVYWWLHALVTRELKLGEAFRLLKHERAAAWMPPEQHDGLVHLWLKRFQDACRDGSLPDRMEAEQLHELFSAAREAVVTMGEHSPLTQDDVAAHLGAVVAHRPELLPHALQLATCGHCGNHALHCQHQGIDDALGKLMIAFGGMDILFSALARLPPSTRTAGPHVNVLNQLERLLEIDGGDHGTSVRSKRVSMAG